MYVLDDLYSSSVAFVEGFNQAHDGRPLEGFGTWVSLRVLGRRSGIHWAYVIASMRVPGILASEAALGEIPRADNIPLIEAMLGYLEEYVNRNQVDSDT